GRLEELGLLDDKEFARAWVEERLRLRPRWRRALREELARKGISREVVEEALHEGLFGVEEYEVAERLLRGMERRYRNLDPERALRRMQDFLLRRGFTWEIVKKVTGVLRKEWFGDEVGGD
ncbi:MAG TPA: RecX family transcriptional regulator, partial [Candidatus Latescibacteria bacterium]|nr:RecX family transcriptional regulator [Candidatus Latescibacterota bacterium]